MEKNAAIMILALAILIVVAAIVVVLLVQQPQNATVADSSNYPGNSSYSSSNPADSGSTPGASNPADSGSTPGAGGQPPGTPISNQSDAQAAPKAKKYLEKYPFYLFKDPNEGAFTINVPAGWQVSNESGLVRPYIDAEIGRAHV